MTKELSPEHLAHSSYVKYTTYVKEALGRNLAEKEYTKLMDLYITSVPVIEAIKKLEKK